jgi:serine/threonine-protein kinase
MLYELLTGKLPFDAESYAHLIVKVRTEQPVPLQQLAPQVPVPLAQVVMVGLAKEPHQRWQSAKELGVALRSALSMPEAGATPAFLPSSPSLPPVPSAAPPGLEKTHTPQPATPAPVPSSGWVVPPGASPAMVVQHPPSPAPAPKSSALKWVLIVLGLLFMGGGCCTCAGILAVAEQAEQEAAATQDPALPLP